MTSEKLQLPPSTPRLDFLKAINTSSLKGQNVLITGGANGIGEAFVEALAEAGAYVTIFDIKSDEGPAVVDRLTREGQNVQFIQGDVRSWSAQLSAFEAAISFPPAPALDIVIPVAGINGNSILNWLNKNSSPTDAPIEPDTRVIDIDLTGVWYTLHLALHFFRRTLPTTDEAAAPSKQIVFVGSLASYSGVPFVTDYSGAKFAVRGMWRSIRNEAGLLGPDTNVNFRTSLIAPTYIKTNMTAVLEEPLKKAGIWMAERSDCVDALLRIVGDEEVSGRAVAIAPGGKSFDLCDDPDGHDSGREWRANVEGGVFGPGLANLSNISKARKVMDK